METKMIVGSIWFVFITPFLLLMLAHVTKREEIGKVRIMLGFGIIVVFFYLPFIAKFLMII